MFDNVGDGSGMNTDDRTLTMGFRTLFFNDELTRALSMPARAKRPEPTSKRPRT